MAMATQSKPTSSYQDTSQWKLTRAQDTMVLGVIATAPAMGTILLFSVILLQMQVETMQGSISKRETIIQPFLQAATETIHPPGIETVASANVTQAHVSTYASVVAHGIVLHSVAACKSTSSTWYTTTMAGECASGELYCSFQWHAH